MMLVRTVAVVALLLSLSMVESQLDIERLIWDATVQGGRDSLRLGQFIAPGHFAALQHPAPAVGAGQSQHKCLPDMIKSFFLELSGWGLEPVADGRFPVALQQFGI